MVILSVNITEEVNAAFSPELVHKTAFALGETEGNLYKAIQAAIPSFFFGIIKTAGIDNGANLYAFAKQYAGLVVPDIHCTGFHHPGGDLAPKHIGNWHNGLASLITQYAGVKSVTAHCILNAISYSALGVIGRHAEKLDLSSEEVFQWLSDQLPDISKSLPAGFSISGLLIGSRESFAASIHAQSSPDSPFEALDGRLWPIVILLVGLGLFWYFLDGCSENAKLTERGGQTCFYSAPVFNP